jgi:peptidyl-prolyl cis-trans isomerase B (cyclophilin B)
MGDIKIELDEKGTPKTAENFLSYARSGFYDGTIFHRVIDKFMIQGGGLDKEMNTKEGQDPIQNEAKSGKQNKKGSLAMARTGDPHSASSQFFINVKDNDFLNFRAESLEGWGYCVFGEVVEGMDVVEKIEKVKTGKHGMYDDVPLEQVIIESVTELVEATE